MSFYTTCIFFCSRFQWFLDVYKWHSQCSFSTLSKIFCFHFLPSSQPFLSSTGVRRAPDLLPCSPLSFSPPSITSLLPVSAQQAVRRFTAYKHEHSTSIAIHAEDPGLSFHSNTKNGRKHLQNLEAEHVSFNLGFRLSGKQEFSLVQSSCNRTDHETWHAKDLHLLRPITSNIVAYTEMICLLE